MHKFNYSAAITISAAALFIVASTSSKAQFVINANYDSSITSDPNASAIESTINSAIGYYEAHITNNVTVNVDFSNVTSGLGSSSFSPNLVNYNDYVNHLKSTVTGDKAFLSLFNASTNPVNGSSQVEATTAQLRALGFNAPGNRPDGADSHISLNTSLMFFNRAADPNKYDLFAVVSHELNEVLGLSSALDHLNDGPSTFDPNGPIGSLDLYRYSAPGVRAFSGNVGEYFSLDGGTTPIRYFNAVPDADFHDWASDDGSHTILHVGSPSVQDAFGGPGLNLDLGPAEIDALHSIGYNFAPSSVPEPSSVAFLVSGFLVAGATRLSLRQKRRTKASR